MVMESAMPAINARLILQRRNPVPAAAVFLILTLTAMARLTV
jgi:hypothetical protein